MNNLIHLIGSLALPTIMFLMAVYVLTDMVGDTYVELREWFRRTRS